MPAIIGPILFARGSDQNQIALSAIILLEPGHTIRVRPMGDQAVEPIKLDGTFDRVAWRYDFVLPTTGEAFYLVDDHQIPVVTEATNRRRVAYVSCNGQEHADDARPLDTRNSMWRRLADEHIKSPFSLLLHGGDQLYADEVMKSHPSLTAWAESDLDEKSGYRFTEEVKAAAEQYLFRRYALLYAQPEIAHVLARIPSIMMWDDHDIIDGWGSHASSILNSDVGRGLFEACKRVFMLFQLGASKDHLPSYTIRDKSSADSLSFSVSFPDFDLIVPDLRSERRPNRVLGPVGWSVVERALAQQPPGRRRFFMSSVPLLGPRLSWIEACIGFVPKLRRYEDDLRDQWQSRAHRDEWRRMLTLLDHTTPNDCALTVLSGEIHLATQAEMPMISGSTMHQMVASGIAHPPPPTLYARALGWLAALGEDPLPGRPIKLKPLPGQGQIYAAERNFLILERCGEDWSAYWELEESGRTPALAI